MKAVFQRGGVLVVYPETTEEAWGLEKWLAAYQDLDGSALLQVMTGYPINTEEGFASRRFSTEEVRLFFQWFDTVQGLNPAYLVGADYGLAQDIYERLGMKMPFGILNGLAKDSMRRGANDQSL